jgi:bile acid:Na+ symporter, BASS family
MSIDRLINLPACITPLEMMVTIGLGVTFAEALAVARSGGRAARVAVANYLAVPAVAVGLLLLFRAQPMVAAGFLIAAVCPGAPYGLPFTAMAKGNAVLSVGLMVILAGSSAAVAPLLPQALLPLMAGNQALNVNVVKMVDRCHGTACAGVGANDDSQGYYSGYGMRMNEVALPAKKVR